MKITYRTKWQAHTAIKQGFEFLLIRRANRIYYAQLSGIADAPIGASSKEYEAEFVSLMPTSADITYRDMMNL